MNVRTTSDDNRWHLKKEIQVTHLIASMTVAASVILYVTKIDNRVALQEAASIELRAAVVEIKKSQSERDDRQDKALKESLDTLRGDIKGVEKLLIEGITREAQRRAGGR